MIMINNNNANNMDNLSSGNTRDSSDAISHNLAGTTAVVSATTINGNNNIPICIATPDAANLVDITNANNNNSCNQCVNGVPTPNAASVNVVLANNSSTNPAAAAVASTEDTEMRHRFKVVKLVSSQPYTRGRWTCFDYNDENQNTINISKHVQVNKIHPNGHPDISINQSDHNCNNTANNNGTDQSEVAIDNKIEQAMDLVKSHLMFAVREEVDVLRERIKELESDIQILKSHATPETLALLSNRSTSIPTTNPE